MIRNCDICKSAGLTVPAVVDTKTKMGPWAYLCEAHWQTHGCGIAGLTNILKDVKE